jgi:TolA-binding protein
VLTLIGWLVMSVAWLTGIHADADESKRRIRDLETRPVVTEQEYRDEQKMVEQQLQRIEDKLDMMENLKQIEQMQRRKPHP